MQTVAGKIINSLKFEVFASFLGFGFIVFMFTEQDMR